MRPYEQRQVLETIQTLKEVINELRKQTNVSTVMNLIEECKEFTHYIRTHIDNITGLDTACSQLLLEYVNMLDGYSRHELKIEKLLNHILKVEKVIKKELKPDKIEVAFLSYNASMSDSLMSIYLSAKEDPECDAYWIPIPYYQVEPNGVVGNQYFEGADSYPNIDCIDWEKYDIEARHPEVIFTFNGYDEYNYITQVHPNFFCKRLKENTDCLVYIPYFVLDDDISLEKFEHFINIPGTWYSDKVILQNEKIKNMYMDVFSEKWKNNLGNPKNKFIALGSAKYDSAIRTKREDCLLPIEWKKKIEGKKVVFYNTSVGSALKNSGQYLKKLLYVLKAFKECDDVILWWRPHPLLLETFSSMRPELKESYKKLVEQFKVEGWGIYDDTSDLHRAIAWSDVYYGDGSSVTELFKVAGKPIYYQDTETTDEEKLQLIIDNFGFQVADIYKTGDSLYALSYNQYQFKISEVGFEFVSEVATSSDISRFRNYIPITVAPNELVYIPHNDKKLIRENKKNMMSDVYELELRDQYVTQMGENARNFLGGIAYNNKIFLVPCGYRNIVAFDFKNLTTEHCLDLSNIFPKEKAHSISYGWAWLNNNSVLMASLCSNEVLEFNLDTYEHRVHRLGSDDCSFHNIIRYKKEFFLIGRQAFVMKWNYDTGEVEIYKEFPEGFAVEKEQEWVFFANEIQPYKNKIVLLGGFTNMAIEFDLDTYEFSKIQAFEDIIKIEATNNENQDLSFSTCNFMLDNFLYFINKNEVLYRYDFERQTINRVCDVKLQLTQNSINGVNKTIIMEMVKSKMNDEKYIPSSKLQDGQAGKRIYEYIKKIRC